MLPTPSYTFVNSPGQRQFFHRWHLDDNEVIECNKCGTICKENDAYSQHWQLMKTTLIEDGDELYSWQTTAIMEHQPDIVSHNIESFMLSQGKAVSDTKQFLLDAGVTALPDLLSVLYNTDGCKELLVKLRFYVDIKGEMFMLQSTELEIKHHYDILESVDIMCLMLLEKLRTFMTKKRNYVLGYVCRIKRLHIQVQRKQRLDNEPLSLPLQYQRKLAMIKDTKISKKHHKNLNNDLEALTLAFQEHIKSANSGEFKPPFPCNLYCFQTCANTRELYAVPYHMSDAPEIFLNSRSFIVLDDISGRFQELQEIGDIQAFLRHFPEDEMVSCSKCDNKYMGPTQLILHERLNCGKDFKITKMDKDFIEIYDECIEIMRCSQWLLYGIIK